MVTLTVDTDGTSGDYSSLSAAVAALPAGLGDDYTIECAASTGVADTTGVSLPNTGSYTLTIQPATGQEHNGVWNDTIYRLETGDANAISWGGGFGEQQNYHIKGLQIRRTVQTSNYQEVISGGVYREGVPVIDSCIIRGPNSSTYRARVVEPGGDNRFSGTFYFINNLVYDVGTIDNVASAIFYVGGSGDLGVDSWFYNNTIISTGARLFYRINQAGYTWTFRNNLISVDDLGQDGGIVGDYNAFSGATSFGGANSRVSQTFTFVDAANDDYHLDSADTGALDHGTDLSADASYAFSDDIDGDTRSGTWDIGADEYVSAGGTTYSVSVSDGISLSDSPSGALTLTTSVADGVSLADSPSGALRITASVSDGVSFADSSGGASTIPLTVADALVLSDEVLTAFTFGVQASDGVTLSDQATEGGVIQVTASDGIVFADSASAVLRILQTISDGVVFSDEASATGTISATVSDGVTFSDAVTTALRVVASVSDGVRLSDVAIDSTFLPVGRVQIRVTTAQASVTITAKQPSASVVVKQPGVNVAFE